MRALTRPQYSIRAWMVFTVCFAVLLVVIRQAYIWWNYVPLATAVYVANENLVPSMQSTKLMLTQDEVITAMEQQLDTIPDTFIDEEARGQYIDKLKEQIAPIVKSRLLPCGSELELKENGVATLQIPFDARTGYKFVIRHPALKRESLDKIRLDTSWRPAPGTNLRWNGTQWHEEETQ